MIVSLNKHGSGGWSANYINIINCWRRNLTACVGHFFYFSVNDFSQWLWQYHSYCLFNIYFILTFWFTLIFEDSVNSDSCRHRSQDICPPISQIVLKNFVKISLIITECAEEILIKLEIVLKISKSNWNTG